MGMGTWRVDVSIHKHIRITYIYIYTCNILVKDWISMILWDWVIEKTIDLVRVQFWSLPAYQIEVAPRKVAPVGNSHETCVRSLFLGFNNACGMLWHILNSCLQIVRSMPEGGFDLSFACNISCHDATLLVFKTPHNASLRISWIMVPSHTVLFQFVSRGRFLPTSDSQKKPCGFTCRSSENMWSNRPPGFN